jgi:SAM-dependent methyltransferase
MPTRIAEKPAVTLDAWSAPLAADPAGAAAFLAEVADRVARRPRVLVPGGGPVADALAADGYAVTDTGFDNLPGQRFDVVYAGSDVLSRLLVQREQVRLVRRLATLLRPGGGLVVQGFHPDPARWAAHPLVTGHDCARQMLFLADARVPLRYVWPAELDLMAELADLALDSRWGGWYGEPAACGEPVVSLYRS